MRAMLTLSRLEYEVSLELFAEDVEEGITVMKVSALLSVISCGS